jgi:hypothetical protein
MALAAADSDIVGGSYMLLCFLSEPKLVRVASLQQWTSPGTVCGAWKNRSFLLQMCGPPLYIYTYTIIYIYIHIHIALCIYVLYIHRAHIRLLYNDYNGVTLET